MSFPLFNKIELIYKKYFILFVSICLAHITSFGQKACYERINDEASKIDSLQLSTGTGFLVNDEGYIITNRHVIERSKSLKVSFLVNGKKIEKQAKIVAWDKSTDLALIKANIADLFPEPLPYSFSKKELKLGEKIYTLGYPSPDMLGESIKLTDGLISATTGYSDSKELYQISAPIQPGNSGSPLFDETGNVRGVIVSSYTIGQNVNYAIKAEFLYRLLGWEKIILKTKTQPKPFKQNLAKIQSRVCLIENVSKKTFYQEFQYSNNKIYSTSESMFAMQQCRDEDLRDFVNPEKEYQYKDAENNKIEYDIWIDKMFKTQYAKALYYSYRTNIWWNGMDAVNKFGLFYELGAYENIIQEHDLKFSFESGKIDESWFQAYLAGFFDYYVASVLMQYSEYDLEKIEQLDSYIMSLLIINDKMPYTKNNTTDTKKEAKAHLLISKARVMLELNTKYKAEEICQVIAEAKSNNSSVDIWYEIPCK